MSRFLILCGVAWIAVSDVAGQRHEARAATAHIIQQAAAQPATDQQSESSEDENLAQDRREAVSRAERLIRELTGAPLAAVQSNRREIAEVLERYRSLALPPQALLRDLLLLRARSLEPATMPAETVNAWRAVLDQPFSGVNRIELLLEAAGAAGSARDVAASRLFLARAKQLTEQRDGQSDLLDIQFKVRELLATGAARDWREVEDEIADMRELAAQFPVWTLDQLNILLLEARLRLVAQPEAADKRESMRSIRAELVLSYEAQRQKVPQPVKDRYRILLRAIDDAFAFERP